MKQQRSKLIDNKKKYTKKSYLCWIDDLNICSLIKVIALYLKYDIRELRFMEYSYKAKKITEKLFKDSIILKHIVPSENTIPLRDTGKIDSEISSEIDNFICKENRLQIFTVTKSIFKCIDRRYNSEKINFFFEQRIARDIEKQVKLYTYFKWFLAHEENIAKAENLFLIKNNYWSRLFYKKQNLEIINYLDIKETINLIYFPIKIIIELLMNSFLILIGRKISVNKLDNTPKIAVLYIHGADLKKKSDYFWFPDSGINSNRILLYFKYSVRGPSVDNLNLLRENKLQWINLLPWKIGSKEFLSGTAEINRFPHALFVKKSLKTLFSAFFLFFYSIYKGGKLSFWYWKNILILLNSIDFFETFFLIFNIKIHFGMYEVGRDMSASNIAIELVGGVDLCSHWSSNYGAVNVETGKPHDIFFTWGPYFKENFFSRDCYRVKKFVYTGYPYDSSLDSCRERANGYRERLLSNGAKFIISFFDQGCSPGWTEAMESIYNLLLNKVIKDKDFGLILKPKKISIEEKFPNLIKLIAEAKSSHRCLVLEGYAFANEAAQASDLAIGIGASSTPIIEAAFSKIPGITFDPSFHSDHPLYKNGYGRVIFSDLNQVIRVIEEKENNRAEKIGDYSFVIDEIDPFQDGKASQRIGSLIKWLLDEFDKEADTQEAIRTAIEKYKTQWGNNKVVEGEYESPKIVSKCKDLAEEVSSTK